MFSRSAIALSTDHRATLAHGVSEIVATAGLGVGDLRTGQDGTKFLGARRGRSLYRLRVFLHELNKFRESRDRRRSNVHEQLRRHRAVVGAALRGAEVIGGLLGYLLVRALYVERHIS